MKYFFRDKIICINFFSSDLFVSNIKWQEEKRIEEAQLKIAQTKALKKVPQNMSATIAARTKSLAAANTSVQKSNDKKGVPAAGSAAMRIKGHLTLEQYWARNPQYKGKKNQLRRGRDGFVYDHENHIIIDADDGGNKSPGTNNANRGKPNTLAAVNATAKASEIDRIANQNIMKNLVNSAGQGNRNNNNSSNKLNTGFNNSGLRMVDRKQMTPQEQVRMQQMQRQQQEQQMRQNANRPMNNHTQSPPNQQKNPNPNTRSLQQVNAHLGQQQKLHQQQRILQQNMQRQQQNKQQYVNNSPQKPNGMGLNKGFANGAMSNNSSKTSSTQGQTPPTISNHGASSRAGSMTLAQVNAMGGQNAPRMINNASSALRRPQQQQPTPGQIAQQHRARAAQQQQQQAARMAHMQQQQRGNSFDDINDAPQYNPFGPTAGRPPMNNASNNRMAKQPMMNNRQHNPNNAPYGQNNGGRPIGAGSALRRPGGY